jgi:hypothetical protein
MKDRVKHSAKVNNKNTHKPLINNGLLEIGKKLGIAIPAGLLLLININTDDASKNHILKNNINAAKELNKLQSNETVKYLLSHEKNQDNIILAQVHANTHTDVNNPNVTRDGKHLNVHTNRHTDYTRY